MTHKLIPCGMALLVTATTCYPPFHIRAWAPLTAAVDTSCLERELATRTGRELKKWKRPPGRDELKYVAYGVDSGRTNIAQVTRRDSSVFLETSPEMLYRYSGEDADSIFDRLATLLLGVRDSCGGTAPRSGRELVVVSSDPPYEGWLLDGKIARMSVKRVSDTYRVLLDTLARRTDRQVRDSFWVQVERSELRKIPKGYALVTDCSQRGLPPDGGVVAVARVNKDQVYAEILHAWQLDSLTLHFRPESTGSLVCRTPVQGAT